MPGETDIVMYFTTTNRFINPNRHVALFRSVLVDFFLEKKIAPKNPVTKSPRFLFDVTPRPILTRRNRQ